MFRKIGLAVIFLLCFFFFSYRLTQIPPGLTGDESAFGYNAILLSRNLRDENNRFLPVFVLSLGGKDWRQPVTQYFITFFFKIFGPSIYNLRITSVIITSISAVLIYLLAEKLMGKPGAFLSLVFFITTPIIMIQSHLALDNIYPIPFILIWLLFLFTFEKDKKHIYLIISAISLGVSFYSYKGMRSFVPVWGLITLIYLFLPYLIHRNKNNFIKSFKPVLVFALALMPFFAIIPYLEFKYAGAVLSGTDFKNIESVYKFFYYYLSSYDPSFLFVSGDLISTHSTQTHGMLLLASLPFFLAGLFKSIGKDKFNKFLVVCFFTGPVLFGAVSSYHRASRLLGLVPIYCLISAMGAVWLLKNTHAIRFILTGLFILIIINYGDFLKYYWYQYPKDYGHTFNNTQIGGSYKFLYDYAATNNLTAYVSFDLVQKEDATAGFLRSIYFNESLAIWNKDYDNFPEKAILMTVEPDIKNLHKIHSDGTLSFYGKEN